MHDYSAADAPPSPTIVEARAEHYEATGCSGPGTCPTSDSLYLTLRVPDDTSAVQIIDAAGEVQYATTTRAADGTMNLILYDHSETAGDVVSVAVIDGDGYPSSAVEVTVTGYDAGGGCAINRDASAPLVLLALALALITRRCSDRAPNGGLHGRYWKTANQQVQATPR